MAVLGDALVEIDAGVVRKRLSVLLNEAVVTALPRPIVLHFAPLPNRPQPVFRRGVLRAHNVQRYVPAAGHVRNEGDVEVNPGGPYLISYRAIRPKPGQCPNLLVPVCLSSSHIAYGSIRMEPVFMILGQSAATAAVQALEEGRPVQDIDYAKLRARLERDGQVLVPPPRR